MPYTRSLNEISLSDQPWAGEKAARLGELVRAGFAVPSGYAIGAGAYRDTFAANQLNEKIIAHLAAVDFGDPAQLEQATTEIHDWIVHVPIAPEIENEIRAALDALNAPTVAVRVSRASEDVPNPSASGVQQAHLAVPTAGAIHESPLLDCIRQCWAAPWNSRAIYFRHRKKISPDQVAMAVVLQTMINSDAAGVLFTVSPMNRNPNEIHIDAIWGLGEAVVAARWRPDHFIVDKAAGTVTETSIATKTVMDVANAEGGVQTMSVVEDRQEIACLSDAQVVALAELGKKAEAHFHEPQDIEWCRVGDEIFLLQSRVLGEK